MDVKAHEERLRFAGVQGKESLGMFPFSYVEKRARLPLLSLNKFAFHWLDLVYAARVAPTCFNLFLRQALWNASLALC